MGTSLYSEPLKLVQRLMSVQRRLKRSEEPRDEISRIILHVLAIKGPQNVSSLAREVQLERGTGSRVTIRKKRLELRPRSKGETKKINRKPAPKPLC
jgi:hypothetical protein